MPDRSSLVFVVVGAGRGRRFGSDKVSEKLGNRTVLETSIAALRSAVPAAPVVAVVAPERVEVWREVLEAGSSAIQVVAGGVRRQDSVCLGVARAVDGGADVVVIHDAARPMVHPDDIRRVIDAMDRSEAVILAAEISDTVKRVDETGIIRETIDRGPLRLAQTPQAFRVAALETAWRRQDLTRDWSDEAALLEADGCEVRSILAHHPNPKLTHAGDIEFARLKTGGPQVNGFRIGQGFDVHCFQPGRPLVLCGVELPEGPGLDGHSDADVALHAVTDALLGAVGEGDLGEHFPASDPRWSDADSTIFLRHALDLVHRAGFRVGNCDLTIVGERPHIAPHRNALRERLAAVLGVDSISVSVKATTTDGLGFIGRGEGLAAIAVVLVEKEIHDE
jgi:2-C-methyl-D-erythritol 4-phosphate cytidylyltransferase/2-C-methyl-D-erythritol 2,4-cyclodiphosphate synthase